MFSSLLKDNRCLVPASGFSEGMKEGTGKIPFCIHLKGNPVFTFA
jgi:putative SOS response-associated peptidase YedK